MTQLPAERSDGYANGGEGEEISEDNNMYSNSLATAHQPKLTATHVHLLAHPVPQCLAST